MLMLEEHNWMKGSQIEKKFVFNLIYVAMYVHM